MTNEKRKTKYVMDEGYLLFNSLPMMPVTAANRIVQQRLSMIQILKFLNKDKSSLLLLPAPLETNFYPMVVPLHQQYNVLFMRIDMEKVKMASHQTIWETLFNQIVRGKRKYTGELFLGDAGFLDPKGIVGEKRE